MTVKQIQCRSILNKSGIPVIDYGINPYIGCEHKCQYCYAVFMKRFSGHTEPWGDFVDVKINASGVLERQLKRLKQKSDISFSTVCDPYQPIEAKYRITRKCLEKLIHYDHSISILTKSDLVLNDLDLLEQLKNIKVGFTITTLNPQANRIFEPGASSAKKRVAAIKKLTQHNIPTWVFVAPTLPYLTDSENTINQIMAASQNAGANYILFDTLNPYTKVWNNVMHLIKKHFPEAIESCEYYYNNKTKYKKQLKQKISKIGSNYKIKFRFAF